MKKTVKDFDFKNKKAIVRVDFNVPLDENQRITDDFRIISSLETIKYLLEKEAAIILMSHLGRPKGKVVEKLRLKPVADKLTELLSDVNVKFVEDCIGEKVDEQIKSLRSKEILLLDNLRFYKEEEENNEKFAQTLANYADVFVNDAFGVSHRAHASTEGITHHLPSIAGFLLEREIKFLVNAVENPQRPFTVIIGGKKVSDKIKVLKRLLEKCDNLLIGGGMAYTFLKAQGKEIGSSILDKEGIEIAKEIILLSKQLGKNLVLPKDIAVSDDFSNDGSSKIVSVDEIPQDWQGLDIGPKTWELFSEIIKESQSVLWNGPVGVFEFEKFAKGTVKIAEAVISSKCISILGGGDTAAAVKQFGLNKQFTHISTGGGASLKLLEGSKLPGLESLDDFE